MKSIALRINDDELAAEIERLAGVNDRSINGEINTALRWYVAHQIRMRAAEAVDREMGLSDPKERRALKALDREIAKAGDR